MNILLDYDEFGIYSDRDEIKEYIQTIFQEGIENEEEIYNMCIEKYGEGYKYIINDLFTNDDY